MDPGRPEVDYLDLVQVAIVVLDERGVVRRINRKGCEILDRPPEEVLGRSWFDTFVPQRLRGEMAAVFGDLLAGRTDITEYHENPVLARGGAERLVAWRNTVVRDASGKIVGTLSSGEDITERQRAEQELADIRYALDQSAIVAITDPRGKIRYVNGKFCEISKYSREELLGQDHSILNSEHHPREYMRGLWQTIQSGQVWRGEIRNRAKDGSLYWVDTTIVPFLDAQGKPYQYLAIHSDVTDRKKAEEEHRRREALATVGQMAAVVAHEVKNPLAGIAGAIEIVGGRLPSDSPDREVIAGILRRIDTLNRRVQDLLLFARPRALRVSPVGLKPLLRETAGLLATDRGLSGTDVEISGQELVIPGDAELLRDVFLNLLLNAAQAMGGRGRIQVVTSGSNSGCTVVVRDTGPGIPPEHQERIFEPFFSSKSGGTGLGLPIAKRIVEAHGGTIGIESRPGEGTAVTVTLPLGPQAPGAAGTARQGEGA